MSFILPALLQVIATQYVAFALPISNNTTPDMGASSSGYPSCDNLYHCRSLLNIIWSCLTTIFLCTWVTVHPDVPDENETSWSGRLSDRLAYLAFMLVSPEAFALVSCEEWADACKITKSLSGARFYNYSPTMCFLIQLRTLSTHSMDGDAWDDGEYGRI